MHNHSLRVSVRCFIQSEEHDDYHYTNRDAAHQHAASGDTFLHRGINGRWEGELTDEDIAAYREMGVQRLGEAGMAWLESGQWPSM